MQKLLLILILFTLANFSIASEVTYEKDLGWASFQDLDSKAYNRRFAQYRDKGYMLVDVEAYKVGSAWKYSMAWKKNRENISWKSVRNMDSNLLSKRTVSFIRQGYRFADIEVYETAKGTKYAAIWVKDKTQIKAKHLSNLTKANLTSELVKNRRNNFRLIDLEIYKTPQGMRYWAVWLENKSNTDWKVEIDQPTNTFRKKQTLHHRNGYNLVDVNVIKDGAFLKYSGVWDKRKGFNTVTKIHLSKNTFENEYRKLNDNGFRLVDFEKINNAGRFWYSGVWVENGSRGRYSRKGELGRLVSKYRRDNGLPGISVAVIYDGKSIYQKGFGFADVANKRIAHSGTIYQIASVSKVIGGTIAVKLQEDRKLRDGTRVALNLRNNTADYLKNVKDSEGQFQSLPRRHRYKVEELFSHSACIEHYKDGHKPLDKFYFKAIDALPEIWDEEFVSRCRPGLNENYSSHAFSYAAAVLERVTRRSAADLVRTEISVPYGLPTIRAIRTNDRVSPNKDRAKIYNANQKAHPIYHYSWIVFGGGIEASPIDLARFGWKVRNNEIVSKSARENILWKRVNSNTRYGIAWRIRRRDGRNVAEHGGSQRGVRTNLAVYRDDDEPLVIAIMTNRNPGDALNLNTLSIAIADIVLK